MQHGISPEQGLNWLESLPTTKRISLLSKVLDVAFSGVYFLKAVRNDSGEVIDFVYTYVNKLISEMLQRPIDEIMNGSVLTLIPENKTNGFFDLFCNVLSTGETIKNNTRFSSNTVNGWFNFSIQPIDEDNIVVTLQDVTNLQETVLELERQKSLVESILKNSSNGISVTRMIRSADGTVVDASTILANDAAVNITGLPREDYLGKTALQIDPQVLKSTYGQSCLNTLSTGVPSVHQYFLEVTGRWLELTISKMDDEHLIHVFSDITAIKEAEQQLTKNVEELKHSNASLEQFAYAASHDLKEPIRKIHIFTDRLQESLADRLNAQEKEYFDRMKTTTQRMKSLVDDLLIYSQVSTIAGPPQTVNLSAVVAAVLEDLEIEIEEKAATVIIGELPTVQGYRRQLQQLFQNLISNALKYQREQIPPKIEVGWRLIPRRDPILNITTERGTRSYHLLEVSDNGIGFDPKESEYIFSMFTRLHGTERYKGSGVGLSIARKVVDNHGGCMWAEGQPNAGAVFKILLPAE